MPMSISCSGSRMTLAKAAPGPPAAVSHAATVGARTRRPQFAESDLVSKQVLLSRLVTKGRLSKAEWVADPLERNEVADMDSSARGS
jgi:hypothetical protein